MVKIIHPSPSFSGIRCGLAFSKGVAYSETPLTPVQKFHFKRWDYTVEGDEPTETAPIDEAEPEAPEGDETKPSRKHRN